MVKQCPRCWAKLSPEDKVCANCGYDLVNRSAKKVPADSEDSPEKKSRVIFPQARKKSERNGDLKLKIATILTLLWTILSVLGGVFNLVNGNMLQGAGFIVSGVLSAIAFMMIHARQHYAFTSILILVSGAVTFQIPMLLVAFVVSFVIYGSGKYFESR